MARSQQFHAKPTVEWEGKLYKVKSVKTEIPDFTTMEHMSVTLWMLHNTYPRGYSKPNPLAGLAGVISVSTR